MRLYESIIETAIQQPDGEVEELIIGWRGSFIRLADGRWNVGATPRNENDLPSSREDHTKNILSLSAHTLARLTVSPYPQEFASASASLATLRPAPLTGSPLDSLIPLPEGDRVFLFAPEPCVVDSLRDWNWNISIFDDKSRGLRVFPSWTSLQQLKRGGWLWLGPDSLRDRRILTLAPLFRELKGVILQGPGIPFLPSFFRSVGLTHLIVPVPCASDMMIVKRYISAGGSPWICPSLRWSLFSLLYMEDI